MDVTEAITTRLELKEFADDPVDAGTKRRILDAGRLAPSGKNLQHWAFILVDDPETLDRLAAISPSGRWVAGADFAVVVLTDPTYPPHAIDAGRTVTHMQLEAWHRGVGSRIYTGIDADEGPELLGYPDDMTVTLVAGFGHPPRPVESYAGIKDREPLEAVAHHNRYGTELAL